MIQQLNLKYCVVGVMMMNGVVYAVLMVQVLAWRSSAVEVPSVKCIESERQALLSLKRGFNVTDDDDWLSSWGDGEQQKECCNWEGVKCSNVTGHVLMLHLHADYYTRGSISPSLGELHHLKYLDLSGNHFTHTPSIPPFIASLTFLTHLDLFSCSFGGNIPPQLGNLLFLQYLDLSSNNLVGGFPLQLTNMSSLRYLDLRYNSLNETMPPQLGNLLSLEHLDLSANAFTGTIPSQFKNLSRLQHLDLHPDYYYKTMSLSSDLQWLSELSTMRYLSLPRVNLSGARNWQQQVSSLSHLQYLDLHACNLVDSVLTSSLASTSLSYVDISNNSLRDASFIFPWLMNSTRSLVTLIMNDNGLTGIIPETLGDNLNSLEELNLANNELKCQIPLSLFHSCNLAWLDLSNNNLTGEFHEYIREYSRCAHKPLQILDMGWNEITGMVPDLSQLQSLQELRLDNNRLNGSIHEGNKLSGTIPTWIRDNIPKLLVLSLHSNNFHGNIPLSMCNLHELHVLDLSLNILSGNIPKCISNLSAMATLAHSNATIIDDYHYEYVNYHSTTDAVHEVFGVYNDSASLTWKGKMSKYGSTLGLLRSIDFSSNRLTGEIPTEMMTLIGLISLNLSRNLFSGHIPPTIGQLKSIDFLDLSRNHLSGTIPSQLVQIDDLSVLDLSYNDLSGEIPLGTQLQTRDASAYAGNPKLCGAPLNNTCPIHGHQISEHDADGDDDEQFVSEGFYIAMAAGFVMAFWGVCFSLILKKSWRYAYFKLLSDVYDMLYVFIAIKVAKFKRIRSQI
ncbi:receptor-like protein EIX2 isoform X5 [Arachis stenosperma]|uniref:receptor-like protein EIX2 isoform X5 n=1 Tax=Arachis stenosperma TaxID=217475 RepID=UPI0025ABC946|nr:receptor-like protein EIX2 isoform X5 [Arachis stenosperma]